MLSCRIRQVHLTLMYHNTFTFIQHSRTTKAFAEENRNFDCNALHAMQTDVRKVMTMAKLVWEVMELIMLYNIKKQTIVNICEDIFKNLLLLCKRCSVITKAIFTSVPGSVCLKADCNVSNSSINI